MGEPPKFAPSDVARWDEAVKWFLARVPMTKDRWLKLTAEARRKAFTVAGVAKADVLHDVHKAIDSAIAKGTTLDDFKKTIGAKLLEQWKGTVKNPAWRLETIYRTSVQQAYSAGRWSQMNDPAVAKMRPVGMFDAILDNRVTERCSKLDGTILTWDEWREKNLVPPLHFNCRSGIRSLRKSRAEKTPKWGKAAPDVSSQEGFGAVPGTVEWKPDTKKYPPDLRKEVEAQLKAAPAPEPMPVPKGAKLLEPPPNAMAAAFDVKLKGKLKGEAEIAFAAIDAAHAVPKLPRIPMEAGRFGAGIEAAYERTKFGGRAIGIKIRAKADHPAFSMLHEIGHFLDHQGHSKPGTFLIETAEGRKLLKVLEQSAAAKSLEKLRQDYLRLLVDRHAPMASLRAVNAQFEYALRPRELWARAYAQWVAVKSGDKTLLKQLDASRARKPGMPYVAYQWDHDEWKAISEAIEEHMKAAGWDPT